MYYKMTFLKLLCQQSNVRVRTVYLPSLKVLYNDMEVIIKEEVHI